MLNKPIHSKTAQTNLCLRDTILRTHLSELLTDKHTGLFVFLLSAQLIIGILTIFNNNSIYYEAFNTNVTAEMQAMVLLVVILKKMACIK